MPKITQRLRELFGRTTVHVSIAPEEVPFVEGLTARQLYATQANLHAMVSFLADSVAQLPLKVYLRKGETDCFIGPMQTRPLMSSGMQL